ncbi:MAG: Asp23/Gls24 family envelope stress response protein [Clostridia bacterium]|nr:Asp23/Gls24 family envelope stress response protein [Clostridia bacterium]
MRIQTDLGVIGISNEVIRAIAGDAASACFGVRGMTATSLGDGLSRLLHHGVMTKGVSVRTEDDEVAITLHVATGDGVNIPAVSRSIISEVRYRVQEATGLRVRCIDVYVDYVRG